MKTSAIIFLVFYGSIVLGLLALAFKAFQAAVFFAVLAVASGVVFIFMKGGHK